MARTESLLSAIRMKIACLYCGSFVALSFFGVACSQNPPTVAQKSGDESEEPSSKDDSEQETSEVPESEDATDIEPEFPSDNGHGDLPPSVKVDVPALPLLFVIDGSASMKDKLSGAENSRFDELWAALGGVLLRYEGSLNIGALLFPDLTSDEECRLPTTLSLPPSENAAAIFLDLMTANSAKLQGQRPVTDALRVATETIDVENFERSPLFVLAVHGTDSCNGDSDQLIAAAEAIAAQGIRLDVFGIETSASDNEILTQAAASGGGQFYTSASKDELQSQLDAMLMRELSCTVDLSEVPMGMLDFDFWVVVDSLHTERQPMFDSCHELESAGLKNGFLLDRKPGRPASLELCGRSCIRFLKTRNLWLEIEKIVTPPS